MKYKQQQYQIFFWDFSKKRAKNFVPKILLTKVPMYGFIYNASLTFDYLKKTNENLCYLFHPSLGLKFKYISEQDDIQSQIPKYMYIV